MLVDDLAFLMNGVNCGSLVTVIIEAVGRD